MRAFESIESKASNDSQVEAFLNNACSFWFNFSRLLVAKQCAFLGPSDDLPLNPEIKIIISQHSHYCSAHLLSHSVRPLGFDLI